MKRVKDPQQWLHFALNGLNFEQLQANIPTGTLGDISYFVRHA